jgi:hypothetical protein
LIPEWVLAAAAIGCLAAAAIIVAVAAYLDAKEKRL